MAAIWVRLMQNTWGRAAVAGVAAVLAFTMWRSGTIDQLLNFRQELHTWTPETSQSQTEEPAQLGKPVEDGRPSAQPEILGKPMDDDKPKQQASLAKALNDLLFGAGGPAAEKSKIRHLQIKRNKEIDYDENGILTFLFAFCPGAGQMYQGYMKRGLSLITMSAWPLVRELCWEFCM